MVSSSKTAEPLKGRKTGKSRVPEALRKRTLISCDRCKKRRIRCLRNDSNESCQSCLDNNAPCESNLPRKTRIYGSVETLSLRYRMLDALLKGLFPEKDTTNIEVLYEIAASHGIKLPDTNEKYRVEDIFDKVPQGLISSPDQSEVGGVTKDQDVRSAENPAENYKPNRQDILIPTRHGQTHYIGPSSSFGFVLRVRSMVAEFNVALKMNAQPGDPRLQLSSDFAASRWSKALETKKMDETHTAPGPQDIAHEKIQQCRNWELLTTQPSNSVLDANLAKAPLSTLLPNREFADALTQAYFDQVHPDYMLFHRNTFLSRYEVMWNHIAAPIEEFEIGWVCCVVMIMIFGIQVLGQHEEHKAYQRHGLEFVDARLFQLVNSSSLVNVQALMLLQFHHHNCSERNIAFTLLGTVLRMGINLGMHREGHREGTDAFDPIEEHLRRRIWWTIFAFEHNSCIILGRPCAIDENEINVDFPDEVLLDGGECVPQGYTERMVSLMRLVSNIKRKIYSSSNPSELPCALIARQLLLELDYWHNSLPPILLLGTKQSSSKHERAVTLLHLQFHQAQVLVTRPFILRKATVQLARRLGKHVRSQDLDDDELALSNASLVFSRKSLALVQQLFTRGQFNGTVCMDPYYMYHAKLVLALDFLARCPHEVDTAEDTARRRAVIDATSSIKNAPLCPLHTTLQQIAIQFAKIVEVDVQRPSVPKPPPDNPNDTQCPSNTESQPQNHHEMPTNNIGYGTEDGESTYNSSTTGNVIDYWEGEIFDLPWKMMTENFLLTDQTAFAASAYYNWESGSL